MSLFGGGKWDLARDSSLTLFVCPVLLRGTNDRLFLITLTTCHFFMYIFPGFHQKQLPPLFYDTIVLLPQERYPHHQIGPLWADFPSVPPRFSAPPK